MSVWLPIADLPTATLGLYDDARFPGRCLLVYRQHAEHLTDLEPPALHGFMDDVTAAASAILAATDTDRMNYAALGNREPHLHFHLIPRRGGADPVPTQAPWKHPEPARPMEPELIELLRGSIRHALGVGVDASVAPSLPAVPLPSP